MITVKVNDRQVFSQLENWEQGRAKPNTQAALLTRMVAQFPAMVQRLEAV